MVLALDSFVSVTAPVPRWIPSRPDQAAPGTERSTWLKCLERHGDKKQALDLLTQITTCLYPIYLRDLKGNDSSHQGVGVRSKYNCFFSLATLLLYQ